MNFETIKCLSQLKNGSLNNSKYILIRANKLTRPVLQILYREGLLLSIKDTSKAFLKIGLKYSCNQNMLKSLKLVSTISNTVYLNHKDIIRLKLKNKVGVLSTSFGLKSLDECRQERLGGVFLFVC